MQIGKFGIPLLGGCRFRVYNTVTELGFKEEDSVKCGCEYDYKERLMKIGFDFDKRWWHGGIAHECLHATHKVLDILGVKPDYDNDEIECYVLEYIVDKVTEIVVKYEKEKQKEKKK